MLDSVGIFFYNTLQVEHLIPKKKKEDDPPKDEEKNEDFSKFKNKHIGNENLVQ